VITPLVDPYEQTLYHVLSQNDIATSHTALTKYGPVSNVAQSQSVTTPSAV